MTRYTDTFLELIRSNAEMMNELRMLRQLNLPDWYAAAGYVRNYLWDRLHGYEHRTPLNDIDIIYYDADETDERLEKQYEERLARQTGTAVWSVKNQARMHIRNGDAPYRSVEDAISHWPETVTAIAVRLEEDDRISFLSPYGLEDIFELRVRKSPLFKDPAYYEARAAGKNWRTLWPKLEIWPG
ncbi:nucleotidyltransferase family protein [Paenibacillus sp. MBLB4367]|uniref:nucleotidyltransferase family protein n=1 Tax=Paenibacillus sp. MBLB4367 TaxID=3384767 RepID=UPI003908378F